MGRKKQRSAASPALREGGSRRSDGREKRESRREGKPAAEARAQTAEAEAPREASPSTRPDEARKANSSATATGSPARALGLFVACAFALFLIGAATFRTAASSYLERLPENYAARAKAALKAGDAVGAIAAFDAELAVRPYNFEARHRLAELALGSGEADARTIQLAALTRLYAGFEAFQAIGARDVHASSWSEGETLRDIARLLAALGSFDASSMAWDAANDADPAWSPASRSNWAGDWPEQSAEVERASRTIAALSAGSIASGSASQAPTGPALLLAASSLPGGFALPSADDARGKVVDEPDAPGGKALLLFRRGAFDLGVRPFPGVEGGARASAAGPRLVAAIRATPAFDGWPYLLVEKQAADPGRREAVGFLRLPSAEWSVAATRLARRLGPGERLVLSYWNDAYDPETEDDRNAFIGWLSLAP